MERDQVDVEAFPGRTAIALEAEPVEAGTCSAWIEVPVSTTVGVRDLDVRRPCSCTMTFPPSTLLLADRNSLWGSVSTMTDCDCFSRRLRDVGTHIVAAG